MRGHAETKKNEQKTEKNNEMHKNILRNWNHGTEDDICHDG